MISYKYRMYPNKEQTERLDFALEMCRRTYNIMLEELREQTVIDKAVIQSMLPNLKICKPIYQQVYSKALQYECYRLFSNLSALSALKKQGRKIGMLRFKGKNWFKTFSFNQSGFELEHVFKEKGRLKLSKIGDIKIKLHRLPEGNIKQITIKKINDKWFAYCIIDGEIKRECGDKVLGIDLGINHYLVDSEGNKVKHPLFFKKMETKIKQAHKNLSRKKKGSNNRLKARKLLSNHYERLKNKRNDFLHKLSTDYIGKCKMIVVEDLNIKGIMEDCYNAKNIADSSWNNFVQMLTNKAENAGCKIVKVNPKNTTKMCSRCGNIQEIELWQRIYRCSSCGLEIDRDYNTSINILNKGSERAVVEIISDSLLREQLSLKQEAITSK